MKMTSYGAFLAVVLVLAGCGDREGRRFGYKGADLDSDEKMYFALGPVTNWLPARVLMTVERDYPVGEREKSLLAGLGVIAPGESFKEMPAGYVRRDIEPWFDTYVKEADALGFKGYVGAILHFDIDAKLYRVGESFFSVYVDGEAAAKDASKRLREGLVAKCNPLKTYDFAGSWVAEYLRYVVICAVGQRADGHWTAMLSVRDKLVDPSLSWVPVDEQKEILADDRHARKITVWLRENAEAMAKNHEVVMAKAKERSLQLFGDAPWSQAGEGPYVCEGEGGFEGAIENVEEFAAARFSEIAAKCGASFSGEVKAEDLGDGVKGCSLMAETDLFTVVFGGEFGVPKEAGGVVSRWRYCCEEKRQNEVVFPAKPVRTVE
ncbi:MAG: hypothetical protein J5807_00180 [Kiritimatiellae bacterium]|nr:hypothetical protein [Kiritimatiellia bacterium]